MIVPCYNEAENVELFQQAVIHSFNGCDYGYEIIYAGDGSRDATVHNLRKICGARKYPVKVVSFSRNFGKEAGLYAGLNHTEVEYIALIDADLQQRPEIVREMVEIVGEQPDARDFRTFRRSVRDSILNLAEYHRFSKGVFCGGWI